MDLDKWIFSAFFRRTSKLGIDFTVGRGHTIHMNLAANPDFDPDHPDAALQERGLETLQVRDREQSHGRSISSSEYRHAQKLQGRDRDKVNFYSESPDPVANAAHHGALVPIPHAPKKKWYKPWTWFG